MIKFDHERDSLQESVIVDGKSVSEYVKMYCDTDSDFDPELVFNDLFGAGVNIHKISIEILKRCKNTFEKVISCYLFGISAVQSSATIKMAVALKMKSSSDKDLSFSEIIEQVYLDNYNIQKEGRIKVSPEQIDMLTLIFMGSLAAVLVSFNDWAEGRNNTEEEKIASVMQKLMSMF